MEKLPTVKELFEGSDNIQTAFESEKLNALLSQEPNEKWVKTHPFIRNHRYIPIGTIEFLLKKIFKKYRVEVMREGVAFNGVYCVVRVWYLNPTSGDLDFHDGIGACELQTAKGKSASDMININSGAVSMAFPIAKTIAIKDACDHFGTLFGANLNRKDVIPYTVDNALKLSKEDERIMLMIGDCNTIDDINMLQESHPNIDVKLFDNRKEALKNAR